MVIKSKFEQNVRGLETEAQEVFEGLLCGIRARTIPAYSRGRDSLEECRAHLAEIYGRIRNTYRRRLRYLEDKLGKGDIAKKRKESKIKTLEDGLSHAIRAIDYLAFYVSLRQDDIQVLRLLYNIYGGSWDRMLEYYGSDVETLISSNKSDRCFREYPLLKRIRVMVELEQKYGGMPIKGIPQWLKDNYDRRFAMYGLSVPSLERRIKEKS